MKNQNHRQCKLQKGITFQYSWIPDKYAKLGKYIKLKDDDGWEVVEVFSIMDSKKVQERSTDYRNQRKVSDI